MAGSSRSGSTANPSRSGKRRALVEAEILERAAALFASRGFAASTLQDIADAMDISRPALYHYISSKDELLMKLVEGVTFRIAHDLEDIAAMPLSAPLRLEQAVERIAMLMYEQPARFRLLERAQNELPEKLAEEHRKARQLARDAMTQIIRDGIEEGSFVSCDPRVVAFLVLGMTNWIAWWIHSERDLSAVELVDTMTRVIMNGLMTDVGSESDAGIDEVTRTLRGIKAGMAKLETLLENGPEGSGEPGGAAGNGAGIATAPATPRAKTPKPRPG